MPIVAVDRGWVLETERTAYALEIDGAGLLVHRYWGKRLPSPQDYPPAPVTAGWASFNNPAHLAQEEYPTYTGMKFTEPGILVSFSDQVRDLVLRFVTAEIDGLRLGILICYDVEFPETARALALAGADLVAVPTALVRPFDVVARTLVPARAYENQVHIAYAGLCGAEHRVAYCGLSGIAAPDGRMLARAGRRPALLTADIDLRAASASRAANPYITDRRPDLYGLTGRAPAALTRP
jgi:predicted amidohydrolase